MYTITCGQPENFCLSEKYLRSLEAPLVQNSTWRGKSNASLYLSSLISPPFRLFHSQPNIVQWTALERFLLVRLGHDWIPAKQIDECALYRHEMLRDQ